MADPAVHTIANLHAYIDALRTGNGVPQRTADAFHTAARSVQHTLGLDDDTDLDQIDLDDLLATYRDAAADRLARMSVNTYAGNFSRIVGWFTGRSSLDDRRRHLGQSLPATLGYQIQLRPGLVIHLRLPADLTSAEARRLGEFIATLPVERDGTAEYAAGPPPAVEPAPARPAADATNPGTPGAAGRTRPPRDIHPPATRSLAHGATAPVAAATTGGGKEEPMIDHRDLTINGTDYTLSVLPDPETEPEGENADAEAIQAWRRGEWRYVGVVLKRDRDNAEASLWGVEYGQLRHDVTITTDNLVNDEYMSSTGQDGVTTTVTLVGALAAELESAAATT